MPLAPYGPALERVDSGNQLRVLIGKISCDFRLQPFLGLLAKFAPVDHVVQIAVGPKAAGSLVRAPFVQRYLQNQVAAGAGPALSRAALAAALAGKSAAGF
jgi:hypothetical protein